MRQENIATSYLQFELQPKEEKSFDIKFEPDCMFTAMTTTLILEHDLDWMTDPKSQISHKYTELKMGYKMTRKEMKKCKPQHSEQLVAFMFVPRPHHVFSSEVFAKIILLNLFLVASLVFCIIQFWLLYRNDTATGWVKSRSNTKTHFSNYKFLSDVVAKEVSKRTKKQCYTTSTTKLN